MPYLLRHCVALLCIVVMVVSIWMAFSPEPVVAVFGTALASAFLVIVKERFV